MNLFTKQPEPRCYQTITPSKSTFIITSRGKLFRVIALIIEFRQYSPLTWYVTEEGKVLPESAYLCAFTSPLTKERYEELRITGELQWRSFPPGHFDKLCKQFGVEIL